MGADLVYMGTRFIATNESLADTEYEEMLIEATLEDLIYTDAFSGVSANYLIPSIRRAGLDPDQLQKKENFNWSESKKNESKPWKDIWSAGQGVGAIQKVERVADIVKELKKEYLQLKRMNGVI